MSGTYYVRFIRVLIAFARVSAGYSKTRSIDPLLVLFQCTRGPTKEHSGNTLFLRVSKRARFRLDESIRAPRRACACARKRCSRRNVDAPCACARAASVVRVCFMPNSVGQSRANPLWSSSSISRYCAVRFSFINTSISRSTPTLQAHALPTRSTSMWFIFRRPTRQEQT